MNLPSFPGAPALPPEPLSHPALRSRLRCHLPRGALLDPPAVRQEPPLGSRVPPSGPVHPAGTGGSKGTPPGLFVRICAPSAQHTAGAPSMLMGCATRAPVLVLRLPPASVSPAASADGRTRASRFSSRIRRPAWALAAPFSFRRENATPSPPRAQGPVPATLGFHSLFSPHLESRSEVFSPQNGGPRGARA